MLSSLKSLFALNNPAKQRAHAVYLSIVTQSRSPLFYTEWQVPDTLDGRFDVIVLHMFMVLSAYEKETEFCRALTELFFADMDRSLREMGVGDTGVGKRVKAMAQAFYGRLKAYGEAIENNAALIETVRRNVWRDQPVAEEAVTALAAYMRRTYESLRSSSCGGTQSNSAGSPVQFLDPALLLRSPQD